MTLLDATGWTLIHFLWEGAIIFVVFAIADAAARRASARIRYSLASVAMLLMLSCAVMTFARLVSTPVAHQQTLLTATASMPSPSSVTGASAIQAYLPLTSYLPWLVYVWITGVTALSTRLIVQWVMVERCRRHSIRKLDSAWQQRIDAVVARLHLRRAVHIYESAIADVPSVVGWLRPVVLVPANALLQLGPGQIEALIAHELAHVRRHDYLINLLQSSVETLFFYHPGVWWVGRRMREERENCCDDLAVSVCGDPIVYARALADLEQFRSNMPELRMAANGGSLLNRIERLIAPRRMVRPVAPFGITALTVASAAVFIWAAPQTSTSQTTTPVAPATAKPVLAEKNQGSFIDQIRNAGFRDVTVDQLIAMKIHGVDANYIAEIKSLGWSPNPDQLVAFRIHGVNAETVKELRAMGYPLDPDQAVAARIHGVTSEFAGSWKQQGLTGLDFDDLIALKIHGADPSQLEPLKMLGFNKVSAKDLLSLRIAGVTPDFISEARKSGLRDLQLEQYIQLKHFGILDSKETN
ncbi:MAG TPA: M56 family metallopeptidase [Bryobacteraceae bacterium]|nr:M56 family metallopeptidase [Bryobacteraceae bacterium]